MNYYVLLAVWIGLQFCFAALLSATEPDLPYALARHIAYAYVLYTCML